MSRGKEGEGGKQRKGEGKEVDGGIWRNLCEQWREREEGSTAQLNFPSGTPPSSFLSSRPTGNFYLRRNFSTFSDSGTMFRLRLTSPTTT
jgi:hypothetical protein